MNYRLNTTMIAVIVLCVIAAIALFTYILTSAPEDVVTNTDETRDRTEEEARPTRDDVLIAAKQQYVDGIHTIAGTVTVPTPCHGISAEPFLVTEGATTTAEIRLTTVLTGEDCPNVPSDTTFRVIFEAPEGIPVAAVWDGASVRLNLVPIAPGESLDEEFFFKG